MLLKFTYLPGVNAFRFVIETAFLIKTLFLSKNFYTEYEFCSLKLLYPLMP